MNRPVWLALLCFGYQCVAQVPQGYYRFPTIHGDTVVFTTEGDLWRVAAAGGVAQRLTTHPGVESHPAISPDGKTLAFAAEYEGPTELYTMPLAGGVPKRQTFTSISPREIKWTPEGRVLYATEGFSTLPSVQIVSLDTQTGGQRVLPLAQASGGAFDPDTKTLFFTRLPKQGSSTKRYQGGWVENLWRFREGDAEALPLAADFKGTSRNPMWWAGRVYFVSDRDGIMNLWSMRTDGSDLQQLTKHAAYDVKSASVEGGRIVYQHGADLRLYDIARGTDTLLQISLASDFDQKREKWVKKPLDYLTAAHISPNGDRLALTARGQVFVAPVEQGRFVEVPRKSGVRYRNARFLADGKSLVAQSDESGEIEFWKMAANGLTPPDQLTRDGKVFRFDGVPSPDGQWIAWGDKDLKFWVYHLERREAKLVAEFQDDDISDFTWSPDSRWLAYVDSATNMYHQIKLYQVTDGTWTTLTSDRVDSFSPAWSPDGKWLYFLSDRELRSLAPSPWGPRQPDPFFTETTKIYQIALTKDLRSPFAPKTELQGEDKPKSEAAEKEGDKPAADKKSSDTNKPPAVSVTIDLDQLASRLHEVPVPAGNYGRLSVTAKYLIWTARGTGFEEKPHLKQLEITAKDPKPKNLVEDIRSFELSADGKKLLIRKADNFYVIPSDATAPAKLEEARVNLDGWTFPLDPREEWRQIFTESWRMIRDFFYDRGMHGLDWAAILKKYLPLVDRVSDRAELSDLISEMVGELSALHIYVFLGDEREGPDQIRTASLGARLARDEAAGGWRVDHIFRADPDYPNSLSPLARPGVDVQEGDVILRINGQSTLNVAHPEMLLRQKTGKQVLIEVKSPKAEKPRQVIVNPISANVESDLRYTEWEQTRRARVEELGRGQIGYVHLRAMGGDNISEWAREYYPVFKRQGLILDVRNNRGGNIDAWVLGKLLRKAWFYWQPRAGSPYWNMHYAFRGHIVVLCNERTASDGEAFTEGFRRLGLGKVIGTRTWGGEIWLRAQRWLVDSGAATAAEYGVYGPEGAWLIEGHGVDPDIVVDNLPHATFNGSDAQLEAAVKHLQELIAKDPRPIPSAPKYPDKSFPK